ncbi:MAG: hypothetical protein ACRDI3_00815 [Actinomycetota bacterium]
MRRPVLVGLCVLVLASLVVPSVGAQTTTPESFEPCGLTTLDATVVKAEDGTLECGPGNPLVVSEDLAAANPGRTETQQALTSFFVIADVQLADEESPARAEGADPCFPSPGVDSSAFRPHETMVPHLMNAHIRAANAIAAAGSPNLSDGFDFLIGLGDLADNQQYNEIRWIIDILDGGQPIDPDTGDPGYHGPQAEDPTGGSGRNAPLPSEVTQSVLELANEPFWATGFRLGNDLAAQRLPWYSLPGNHDVKVQGTLPDEFSGQSHQDGTAWRATYRRYYIGGTKVVFQDVPPEQKQRLCAAMEAQDDAAFIAALTEIVGDPQNSVGRNKIVPADPTRMPLYRTDEIKQPGDQELCLAAAGGQTAAEHACESSWVEEHFDTTGIPVGHGYGEDLNTGSERCHDENGLLERACYSFSDGLFHYIGLDSNPPEGAQRGNIDPAQFDWLERELKENSTSYYEDGVLVENPDPDATDRLIVVFAHHPTESMSNVDNGRPTSSGKVGQDLIDLLLRFPNVILNANGHSHRNKIWARSDADTGTGYWEVNTAAIADYPTQSRVIEIADNRDGTLSIFGTVFDAWVAPNADFLDWFAHDHTHETELVEGASQDINEDWLASWGREVMFNDPQQSFPSEGDPGALGLPGDRNVELLVNAPEWFGTRGTGLTYTGPTSTQVGSEVTLSARLTTRDDGRGIEGQTVTFERSGKIVSGVTGSDGLVEVATRYTGQPGTAPLTITYEGSTSYRASTITVDFTTFHPGTNKPPRAPTANAVIPAV